MKKTIILLTSLIVLSIFVLTFYACNKASTIKLADEVEPSNITHKETGIVLPVEILTEDPSTHFEFFFGVHASSSTINKDIPNSDIYISVLKKAIGTDKFVTIGFDNNNEVVYTRFSKESEIREWEKLNLSDKNDSRLSSTLPNVTTMNSIFNDLKAQGCGSSPSPSTSPCISFRYVKDGCYARAHKMKQRMESQFGYTCQKIFNYGTNYTLPTLKVKANLWGNNCCVAWKYHVAPLVTVGSTQYVLDPSLFTSPVTISTWRNAQTGSTPCSGGVNYSYSIQSGSKYAPYYTSSTSSSNPPTFITDPFYLSTNSTLNSLLYLTGCY